MRQPPNRAAPELMRERLVEGSVSQSDVALRLGVSTGAVSRWLSGERRPSLEMAFRIEQEFGIPAETWIGAPDEPVEEPPASRTGTGG